MHPAPSHQSPPPRRDQAARRSRRGRADDRTVAHHALFRSDQDRQPVRPDHPPRSADDCASRRIGRANLTAAFPEKSPEEIETILAGVWDNLGRIGAEFAHLDHIWEYDPAHPEDSRIEIRAAHPRTVRAAADRRQAGADLRKPSRQLGTACAWPRSRTGWMPRSCFAGPTSRRPTAIIEEIARGQDGHADPGRPRRARSGLRRRCKTVSTSPCWSTSI